VVLLYTKLAGKDNPLIDGAAEERTRQ